MYEKQIDLDHEKKLMEAIERKFDFTLVKLPMKYNLDALAFKAGNAKCFFEFKNRSHISKRYPTAFVSLEKVMASFSRLSSLLICDCKRILRSSVFCSVVLMESRCCWS